MSAAGALDARLRPQIQALRDRDLHRQRRVVDGSHGARIRVDGRDCVNFCANDYLGLAADPRLAEAARASLARDGTGSGAAALISGHNREHRALEEALADFLGAEAALLFSSGWAANLGALRALAGPDTHLCADALNHASLIDGVRLTKAPYARVTHADAAAFDAALGNAPDAAIAVTDGVFSMDGDVAPLPELAGVCARRGATLYVDDAHGFGVCGPDGRGSLAAAGLSHADVPVYVATLGKSLGASGAFVAGSRTLIDYLVQKARTWVFSTAPPPALSAAARAGLAVLRSEPERLAALHANIAHFRAGATERGIRLGPPDGAAGEHAIQPLLLGDAGRTMAASRALFERGYWVAGIRPPTVPAGTSRLRLTLSAAHTREQIEGVLDALHAVLAPQAEPA
ncbi:8-amino-7-oxononanoate synthase [Algiphilus sp.]|uniref:aminotransferase class I/II-fold pyridoxal phosphate-dependent enzyme n=1 Tax=Algiphilus sp. TaxID=1872431 RepID=UPI0025C628B6|nr:8-amino-7-oxononanoate synthase [Algiphilus sp.]